MAAVQRRFRLDAAQEPARQAFLGVTASARGYAWRERLEPGKVNAATAISQRQTAQVNMVDWSQPYIETSFAGDDE